MSTAQTFQSLTLRKHPFSFAEGLASAFDYTPLTRSYNVCPTPNAADAKALGSDFIITGNTCLMREASPSLCTRDQRYDRRRNAPSALAQLKVPPHVIERILNHTTGTLGGVAGITMLWDHKEMRETLTI